GPDGVADAIRKLEGEVSREALAFKIAEMVVDGKFGRLSDAKAAEQAIRTCLAVITEGIAASAPIEGISKVDIRKNFDGTLYLAIYFAGPIRAAGGTAAALAVLAGDFVRRKLDLSSYSPSDLEVERFEEEVNIYSEVKGLQYAPTEESVRKAVRNIPVEITGDPTEQEVVAVHRDLDRIKTNRVRGGAILAMVEGVLQKAPKLMKRVEELGLDGWDWLSDLSKSSSDEVEKEGPNPYPSGDKYLADIIAGRSVFGHPHRAGGFRLRYGRARNTGLAAAGVHPATMRIVDDHISTGTQLKTERPGKATAVTPVDTIDGPVVKLEDGSVVQVNSVKEAEEVKGKVSEILSLGDLLFGFGEFLENNHPLMPAGYCPEWWAQEVKEASSNREVGFDLDSYINPPYPKPSPELAVEISEKLQVPLHPDYTFPFNDLELEEIEKLGKWLAGGESEFENGVLRRVQIKIKSNLKRLLERLGIPHRVEGEDVVIEEVAFPLYRSLGLIDGDGLSSESLGSAFEENSDKDPLEVLKTLSGFPLRAKAPTRIGCRVGRPEKAKPRKMRPSPHVLFPVGRMGGRTRSVSKAADKGTIKVEVANCRCPECGKTTIKRNCPECGVKTEFISFCPSCNDSRDGEQCMSCGASTVLYKEREIELQSILNEAVGGLQEPLPDGLKGVLGMTSAYKIPEPLEKGILRAKHGVYVFKDGTVRFDATDVPLTHFRPSEIKVSLKKLRELGYKEDYKGEPLKNEGQLLELKPQDILLSKPCADYLLRSAKFVDDLLEKFYDLEPFYKVSSRKDLVGHLVIGLAPHTSAGIMGRIIGFSDANVGYSHPYFHAAKRRNCFDYNHRVFLYDEGRKRFITKKIGELVEGEFQNGEPAEIDIFGTEKVDIDRELHAYVLDRDTGKIVKKPVKCFIRGSTKEWIEITTSTNRKLKITPDHHVSVIKNGKLQVRKAADIRAGERVPISIRTPVESRVHKINVAKELSVLEEKKLHRIRLRNASDFFKKIVGELGRERVFEICGDGEKFPKNLFDWYKSVPLSHFKKICGETERVYDDLPKHVEIGIRDGVSIPCYIEDASSLFWLLGVYCAEGWSGFTEGSHHVFFGIGEGERRKRVKEIVGNIFGLKPSDREDKLEYSSKVLELLISGAWEAGSAAHGKKVPEIVYRGSDEDVRNFFSAFFDENGSIDLGSDRVIFYSHSQALLEGVSNLLLRTGIFSRYHQTREREPSRRIKEEYRELNTKPAKHGPFRLILTGGDKYKFVSYVRPTSEKKKRRSAEMIGSEPENARRLISYKGKDYEVVPSSDYTFDIVKKVERIATAGEDTYCLDVEGGELLDKNVLWHNQLIQLRCDGDEDAVMLLLDALLNFSRYYLPEKRGGKMDAPLVLTTRLDPAEVDDEVHNMDVVDSYPLEFYEATQRFDKPAEWASRIETVKQRLGSPGQYKDLRFSRAHDTSSISAGPAACKYKSLGSMVEKTESQLSLARKIMAVDERDVAERVIEHHFIPDLKGNLRAFATQDFRCTTCNKKYRRVTLTGECYRCGGKLMLNVSQGGVKKYLGVAMRVAKDYGVSNYIKQRLDLVEEEIRSLFESDDQKQLSLADFA
ncbi:hypothetical protein AKJ58_01530, partial [candidate division MSBL1 archaeon SCGC-AAA385D11]